MKKPSDLTSAFSRIIETAKNRNAELANDPYMAYCEKHGSFYEKHKTVTVSSEEGPIAAMCVDCAIEGLEGRKQKREISRKIQALDLGPRFEGLTFSDYVVSNDGQKTALSTAKNIVDHYEQFQKKGTQILFYGKSGTGKTMLECIIAQELIKRGYDVTMITVQKLIRSIRSTFSTKDVLEQSVIDLYASTGLLMLDEVGVSLQSDYEKTVLFEILDQRYKFIRPTLMTSNFSVQELESYLGFRLMRRFRDSNGRVVYFDWEEYKGGRE